MLYTIMGMDTSRRAFTKSIAGAAAIGFPYIGWKTTGGAAPSNHVRFANFGAAGRAGANINEMLAVPNTSLVAAAEIDTARLKKSQEARPDTRFYQDWRELLDKEADNIDAVIVATPDHMHAPIAMSAMQLGKHAYCEKPLTRTLDECRTLQTYAAEKGLITQMGNQVGSAMSNRSAVQSLRDGLIGKVKEVHSMVPKSWGAMKPLPDRTDPVPDTLDWDGWLGVGRQRDYISGEFHPGQWRKRLDYGTGTLGDMGCHIYHPWFLGLDQPVPLAITSHGPGPVDTDSWPLNGRVVYHMQGTEYTDGDFEFTWYDGQARPDERIAKAVGGADKIPPAGSVIIGTEGTMVIFHSFDGVPLFYHEGERVRIRPSVVPSVSHHGEWVANIRGDAEDKPVSHWDYAGPMTEAVLLGCIAQRLPGKMLNWDAKNLRFSNSDAANELVKEEYRSGWEIEGL